MRNVTLSLLFAALLLTGGCSIQFGIERSQKVPFKASYSVTHYRAQDNCEECESYTPSYTNFSTPIQCRQVDSCSNCDAGQRVASCPR